MKLCSFLILFLCCSWLFCFCSSDFLSLTVSCYYLLQYKVITYVLYFLLCLDYDRSLSYVVSCRNICIYLSGCLCPTYTTYCVTYPAYFLSEKKTFFSNSSTVVSWVKKIYILNCHNFHGNAVFASRTTGGGVAARPRDSMGNLRNFRPNNGHMLGRSADWTPECIRYSGFWVHLHPLAQMAAFIILRERKSCRRSKTSVKTKGELFIRGSITVGTYSLVALIHWKVIRHYAEGI